MRSFDHFVDVLSARSVCDPAFFPRKINPLVMLVAASHWCFDRPDAMAVRQRDDLPGTHSVPVAAPNGDG